MILPADEGVGDEEVVLLRQLLLLGEAVAAELEGAQRRHRRGLPLLQQPFHHQSVEPAGVGLPVLGLKEVVPENGGVGRRGLPQAVLDGLDHN